MSMRKFLRPFAAFAVLSGGLVAGSVFLMPGTASAAACGTAIAAGTSCTMTGSVSLTSGALTLTSPGSLSWAATLTGTDQSVADVSGGDEQYTVNDATGSGAGWHVTLSATTFTNGSHTFPNSGTLVTNGSTTSVTSTTAPSATCTGTCTLPSNGTTYPVDITTAAVSPIPAFIYDTASSTGLGQVVIGGVLAPNPVGWWVNIPASASAGIYTSTITMEAISGP
jgi:hypothetical protein